MSCFLASLLTSHKTSIAQLDMENYNWGFDDYHDILMINDHYYNHDHSMVPPARPSPILLYMGLNDILTNGSVTGEEALLSWYRKKPNEKYHLVFIILSTNL